MCLPLYFAHVSFYILGKYSEDMFYNRFWLDTYYNPVTGKFHFTKSDDEVGKFNFLVPMTPGSNGDYTVYINMMGVKIFCISLKHWLCAYK